MQLIIVSENLEQIPKILEQYDTDTILVFGEDAAKVVVNWAIEHNKGYIVHHE